MLSQVIQIIRAKVRSETNVTESKQLTTSIIISCVNIYSIRLSSNSLLFQRRKWQPTPVFLPEESQGRGSLVGCRLWGRTESDTPEAT